MAQKHIYLDYAAATPVDEVVLRAMTPYFIHNFYNPSATYLASKRVLKDIESARGSVAQLLSSKPSEIVFTAGGTEANNLAIQGIMDQFKNCNLIVSAIEHESVLEPAKQYLHKIAPVNDEGFVDLAKLSQLIDDKTVLVSIMYANNEIGTIEPLSKIAEIINSVRAERLAKNNHVPIYFHSDACQVPAYLDIHVSKLGLDLMTLNGGKIYGPKQSGILYVNRSVQLIPQILGGGQEFGIRSGTENVAGIIGFAKALELVQDDRKNELLRTQNLQVAFRDLINGELPDTQINGPLKNRLPSNLNVTLKGYDNETLLMQLDELGIECASGSACNARSDQTSHVLAAIGLSEDLARSSLRFSFGKYTSIEDIKYTVSSLAKLVK